MFNARRYPRPWRLSTTFPPERIRTERLVLRCWEPGDAPLFQSALAPSLEYVSEWIPPALDEPSGLEAIAQRLAGFRDEFRAGVGFVYVIMDSDEAQVLGEIGLMPRVGPRALEIGYWIRIERAGHGLATEATRALTDVGLALPEVDRIEIHCDPANAASAAVPRKLGYRLIDGVSDDGSGSALPSADTLVFEITAPEQRGGDRG